MRGMAKQSRSYQASRYGDQVDGARESVVTEENFNSADEGLDRDLLLRAARQWPQNPGAETIDPLDMAAFLDGRLAGEERDAFEARLARDPEGRAVWSASAAALGAREPVPKSLLRRAEALAPDLDVERPTLWQRLSGLLSSPRPIGGMGWAFATALFLAVCYGGFELGQVGYMAARDGSTQTAYLEQLPFEPQPIF